MFLYQQTSGPSSARESQIVRSAGYFWTSVGCTNIPRANVEIFGPSLEIRPRSRRCSPLDATYETGAPSFARTLRFPRSYRTRSPVRRTGRVTSVARTKTRITDSQTNAVHMSDSFPPRVIPSRCTRIYVYVYTAVLYLATRDLKLIIFKLCL